MESAGRCFHFYPESIARCLTGQCAPAIILTEIDFTDMSNTERNKLFTGLTRAQMAVDIVMSPNAEAWFIENLN